MLSDYRVLLKQESRWNLGCLIILLVLAGWPLATMKGRDNLLTGPTLFTVPPLQPADIRAIIPLGNLNPKGGHVFPTDHIYFDYGNRTNLAVVALAPGRVIAIRPQSKEDFKIEVQVNDNFFYYLAHLYVAPGIKVGSELQAAQIVGHVSGRSWLDLGAYDTRTRLKGFSDPRRYPVPALHAVSPLAFFAEPLKSQLYAKINREGPDKDGKIDFDQPGRLVGNWFLQNHVSAVNSQYGPEAAVNHLAFVYDVRQPKAVRISIGGIIAPAGVYGVPTEAPDPVSVRIGAGLVKYELFNLANSEERNRGGPRESLGVLLVQLIRADLLMIEYRPGLAPGQVDGFSPRASVYER